MPNLAIYVILTLKVHGQGHFVTPMIVCATLQLLVGEILIRGFTLD